MKRPILKHNISSTALVIVLVATIVTSMAGSAQAENACSLARAAGTYAISDSGTVVGIGPRTAVSQLRLDRAGNLSGPVTASLNGAVTHATLSGTYTVTPDCTGTASFSEKDQSGTMVLTATVDLFWDDNMREVRFIFTSVVLANGPSLAIVISGDGRKLVP